MKIILHHNAKDISNQRFGRLLAAYPTPKRRQGSVMWSCKCSCGNNIDVPVNALRSGNTTSCGCLRSDTLAKMCTKDLIGERFGRLEVLSATPERHYKKVIWKCICECGNIVNVPTNSLTTGNTKSCGCLRIDTTRKLHTTHGLSHTLEYGRAKTMKCIALKVGARIGNFTSEDIKNKMEEWGNTCIYCGDLYEQADHLIPLSRGGPHSLDNLVPSCSFCNQSKHNKFLGSEWMPNRREECYA